MRQWISREEEASFPKFHSFEDAWTFFVKKYDKDILLESMDIIDGKKLYYCALIIDWDVYKEMLRLFTQGEPAVGNKYMECRQPIQIFEDGNVHVVH